MPHLHRHQQGSSIGHFSFLPTSTCWCFGTPRLTPMQTPLQYSRLPLQVEPSTTHTPHELILLAEHLDDSPVTANDICEWTKKAFLKYCISSIRGGQIIAMQTWSHFFAKRTELSVYDGCILWGTRVFIPPPGRDTVLHELHEGHPGITKMKAICQNIRQGLMWRSRSQYVLASAVRKFNLHLQLHLSTLGSGHPCHGCDCIWILRGHLRIKCFSF